MAFTRKFLSALGIEQDKIDEIIQAHTEVTDALKEERDKYKEDAGKLPEIEKQLNELKEQVSGEDPYKEKLEKLQKEYDDYKADVEAQATTAKKEKALRNLLKEIGLPDRRMDAVVRISDISKIELTEDGNVKDGDKLKESLKAEYKDLIPTTRTEGASSATPPANTGKGTMTKEEIRKIEDPIARQKAMLDNPTLFGLPEN